MITSSDIKKMAYDIFNSLFGLSSGNEKLTFHFNNGKEFKVLANIDVTHQSTSYSNASILIGDSFGNSTALQIPFNWFSLKGRTYNRILNDLTCYFNRVYYDTNMKIYEKEPSLILLNDDNIKNPNFVYLKGNIKLSSFIPENIDINELVKDCSDLSVYNIEKIYDLEEFFEKIPNISFEFYGSHEKIVDIILKEVNMSDYAYSYYFDKQNSRYFIFNSLAISDIILDKDNSFNYKEGNQFIRKLAAEIGFVMTKERIETSDDYVGCFRVQFLEGMRKNGLYSQIKNFVFNNPLRGIKDRRMLIGYEGEENEGVN